MTVTLLFPFSISVLVLFNLIHIYPQSRFPIVEPDPGHTKLRLAREGLDVIEKITTPIAVVAVSFSFMIPIVAFSHTFDKLHQCLFTNLKS